MQTRKALAQLSKGDKVYEDRVNSPLLERSAEYLEQYENTETHILAQQRGDEMALPFLESLRRKVASMVSSPNEELPVVTRFDLYTGIRKISERSVKDMGLKRMAQQLERVWQADPLGSLTYGQVKELVRSFKDNFPRSAAADAVEAECSRVGLHKLPVAKLARLASKVTSQEDYEAIVKGNKLDGDRVEQVRARTLIRSLVSMRSGTTDVAEAVAEKLADRNASVEKAADYEFTVKLLDDASSLADTIGSALDQGSQEAFRDGFEDAGQMMQDLSSKLDQWMGGLTDVRDRMQIQPEKEAPAAPAKPQKPMKPAPTPEEMQLQNDMSDAGMGKKKLLDPRTWFASKGGETIKLAKMAAQVADLFEAGEMSEALLKLSSTLAAITGQLAPMAPPKKPMMPGMPEEMPMDEAPGMDMGMEPPAEMGDGMVQQPELEQGVDVLEEIEQAADEIIQQAPPQAVDYIQHEMGEGHLAPPGTAEWGAEEILNEGHEFAPPTEGWLQEEEQELGLDPAGGEMPMPEAPGMGAPPHAGPGALGSAAGDLPKPPPTAPYPNQDPEGYKQWEQQHGKPKPRPAPPAPGMKQSDRELMAKAPPGMEDTVMKLKRQYPGEPEKAFATAWSIYNKKQGQKEDAEAPAPEKRPGGKGIPLPKGKIKQQQEVQTYAKKVTPSGGGKALKASDIEGKLLDGKRLKVGDVSIHINTSDEVEIWEKDAGRACALIDIDVAIADFMAMTGLDKFAQAAPAAPAAPAPGAPGVSPSSPLSEIIQSGLTHYKNMGMGFLPAVSQLKKDFKERETEFDAPEAGQLVMAVGSQLWGGAQAAPAEAAPGGAPAEPALPPSNPVMPMAAGVAKDAEGKMKEPAIRKPKDHVSVPKDVGPDSETKESIPAPGGAIKTQPNKEQHGKLSPKELGKDSEGEDLLPDPGKPSAEHNPADNAGIKLPAKGLDKDLEGEDPFKTPGLKSAPSPRKE